MMKKKQQKIKNKISKQKKTTTHNHTQHTHVYISRNILDWGRSNLFDDVIKR